MEDLHDRWPHRWMTSKVECRNSKIHGIGIFALEKIRKGEVVCIVGGIVVPNSEIEAYWSKVGYFGVQVSDDFWIVPSTKEEIKIGGAFNHSCNPNTGWAGEIRVVAIRDIKEGKEVTMDYGMYNSVHSSFECNCGSSDCRKIIGPDDWQLNELQEKYFDYFVPYLKEKIKK